MYFTRAYSMSVVLMSLFFASICLPASAQRFHESDGYFPVEAMPVSVYGLPVGESLSLKIRLPDTFKPKDYPLTLLWLSADDIDAQKETRMFINGQGPFPVPASTLGEAKGKSGLGNTGHMQIKSDLLKPGLNELKFVFADNLGGSTGGFDILDAMIVLPRPDGKVDTIPMIERELYIQVPDHPKLAIYNSTLDPRIVKRESKKPSGWKPHDVRKGDGQGGWSYLPGQIQFLHAPYGQIMPFGLAKMDNGELVLAANWNDGHNRIVLTFSKDSGATWSDWHLPRIAHGRPMGLAALGKGRLTMVTGSRRYFSSDYGRSFPVKDWVKVTKTGNGLGFAREGNDMVDIDADGNAALIMQLGHNLGPGGLKSYPRTPSVHFIRSSTDGGKTWTEQPAPKQWHWTSSHNGKDWPRGTNEGSLVRAKNGWIIAAMRTDMPAEFFHTHHDHWEGTAVSISKDNAKTWSPLNFIYKLGRMHAHLLRLPNGDLFMGYIVRQDLNDDGTYASYSRGMEGLLSHDNGLTWDKAHKYAIDAWPFVDPDRGPFTLVCGHTCSVALDDGGIISAYGHYPSKGGVLIRWKPE
jgi:hypothetical protein